MLHRLTLNVACQRRINLDLFGKWLGRESDTRITELTRVGKKGQSRWPQRFNIFVQLVVTSCVSWEYIFVIWMHLNVPVFKELKKKVQSLISFLFVMRPKFDWSGGYYLPVQWFHFNVIWFCVFFKDPVFECINLQSPFYSGLKPDNYIPYFPARRCPTLKNSRCTSS